MRPRAALAAFAIAATLAAPPARADAPPAEGTGKRDPMDVELEAARAALPARIDFFEIRGCCRTQPYVVLRELYFEPGQVVTFEQWKLAVVRLWNMQIFDRVRAWIERRPDGTTVAVFDLEERWTLGPIFNFAVGGSTFYLRVGALENNFLGRFLEVGGFYERFDVHNGGQLSFRDPRFLGTRMDLRAQVDRLIRPRPGFADQRTRGRVELNQLAWEDRLLYGARLDVLHDNMLAPPDPTETPNVPPSMRIVVVDAGVRVGRVDTVRIRRRGASLELRPMLGLTSHAPVEQYGGMWGEAFAFFMFGERWNVALRGQAGAMTKAPVQQQFWIGGLDMVRGFPDSHVRARAFVLGNAEVRFTVFDSTWFAVVPTVFVDAAAARRDEGGRVGLLSAGGGVRLLIPRLLATGLRVDVATPLSEAPKASLSLGVYQFF